MFVCVCGGGGRGGGWRGVIMQKGWASAEWGVILWDWG